MSDTPATAASAPVQPATAAPPRALIYVVASLLLSGTAGLGGNLVATNIPQIAGHLSVTTNEANWLYAAYMAPYASMSLLLFKIRQQYGLRNFAEVAIAVFLAVSVAHLFVHEFRAALILRFLAGVAAAPMSTLSFLYMVEPLRPEWRLRFGLPTVLTNNALSVPIARLISPTLLDLGGWQAMYLMELALAALCFMAVYTVPLTPAPRMKVIKVLDLVSYVLIAVGLGCAAVVFTLGRLYWWFEAGWIGVLIAVSIGCVATAVAIEVNRKTPLIDIAWLTSREVIHLAGVLVVFRIVLSETSSGAGGLFQALGLQQAQIAAMWWAALLATLAGGIACMAVFRLERTPWIHAVALIMIGTGALIDANATNLTRPEQMMLSQALIACGGALFMPPAMAVGLVVALRKGPGNIISFIVVFLATQNLGGQLGSALIGTFVTIRTRVHTIDLASDLTLSDPLVAQRVTQLGQAYSRVLGDRVLLNAEGVALLGQQATREATVLAYNDVFMLIATICAAALVALLVHVAIVTTRRRALRASSPQVQ